MKREIIDECDVRGKTAHPFFPSFFAMKSRFLLDVLGDGLRFVDLLMAHGDLLPLRRQC